MTPRPPRRKRLRALTALLLVGVGARPAWAAAPATGPYYDRTLMAEAGARCRLFTPPLLRSLQVGAAQARSAALALGAAASALDAAAARATTKARTVSCDNPDLRIAAQRVRAAFMSWSRQASLALPGPGGGWRAERPWTKGARWTLFRHASLGGRPLTFGLARIDGPVLQLVADAALPEAPRAYAARLVMRDAARAPEPYLPRDGAPPVAASRGFLAQSKGPADPALGPGTAFRFPNAAADALAGLDPRESVRLELVFPAPGRERVVAVLLPVGDFATGRAFLSAGP